MQPALRVQCVFRVNARSIAKMVSTIATVLAETYRQIGRIAVHVEHIAPPARSASKASAPLTVQTHSPIVPIHVVTFELTVPIVACVAMHVPMVRSA